jgi:hypothetical protein
MILRRWKTIAWGGRVYSLEGFLKKLVNFVIQFCQYQILKESELIESIFIFSTIY